MATLYVTVWEGGSRVVSGDPLQEFLVDIAATSTQSTVTITGDSKRKRGVRIFPSADCYLEWGADPTATATTSRPLAAEVPEYFEIEAGYKIAVIERAAASVNSGNTVSTSSFNSRPAAAMAARAVFQGVGEDVSGYGRAGVSISTSNPTAGTLTIEVSHDNVNWGGPNRTWADTRFAQPHMWNIVEKYFRIKYTNGESAASDLSIQVQYSNNIDIFLGHQLDETLKDETEAIAVRGVIVGRDSFGAYHNVGIEEDSNRLEVQSSDTLALSVHREVLAELRKANKYLRIIADFELIDTDGDL